MHDNVVREDRSEAKELTVERRHDRREDAGREESAENGPACDFTRKGRIALGLAATGGGMRTRSVVGPNTDQHARHPDDHDEDRMGDDRQLEAPRTLCGQPVLKKVRKHSDRQRNQQIEQNLVFDMSARVAFSCGICSPSVLRFSQTPSFPPSWWAITKKVTTPRTMKTSV